MDHLNLGNMGMALAKSSPSSVVRLLNRVTGSTSKGTKIFFSSSHAPDQVSIFLISWLRSIMSRTFFGDVYLPLHVQLNDNVLFYLYEVRPFTLLI